MSRWSEEECDRADIARDEWKDERVQTEYAARKREPDVPRASVLAHLIVWTLIAGGTLATGVLLGRLLDG